MSTRASSRRARGALAERRLRGPASLLAAALALAVVFVAAPVARAHPLGLGALVVTEREGGILEASLHLSPDEAGVARPELTPATGCESVGAATRAERGDGTLVRVVRMRCEGEGASLAVDGLSGSDVRVLATVRLRGAPERRLVLEPDAARLDLARGRATGDGDALSASIVLGATHVALGVDHLLFVLGLLLLSRTPRALVLAITGFTLGHSVTLGLATLGVLSLSSAPVEITIALSLVLVALEAERLERVPAAPATLAVRWPWLVAGLFGLVHGLGFASALAALDLGEGRLVPTLVGFNVGVELGQLAFVALVLVAVRALAAAQGRAGATPPRLRRLAAHAIGGAGTYLAASRALGRGLELVAL